MQAVYDLAKSFLATRGKKDEKRRVIDFVLTKKLKELESGAIDVDGKLRVLSFKNDMKNEEVLYEQYCAELNEITEELKPILTDLNANQIDPLRTHLEGKMYFDTWLDVEGNIQSGGAYHKMG